MNRRSDPDLTIPAAAQLADSNCSLSDLRPTATVDRSPALVTGDISLDSWSGAPIEPW